MNTPNSVDTSWQELLSRGESSGTLVVPTDHGDLHAQVKKVGPIACELECLSCGSEHLKEVSPEQLQAVGEALCHRVNYLMEPLEIIETDSEGASVQVRSSPPSSRDGEVRYFEARIDRQRGFCLTRYGARHRQQRQRVGAPITKEVLQRLVNDCAASLDCLQTQRVAN